MLDRDFDPNQPRDDHGRWSDEGGGDDSSSQPDRITTVPIGLGVPEGSALAKAGIQVISYKDAERVATSVAAATGADIREMHQVIGGWTDPSDGKYYPEPVLVAEFAGQPEDIKLTAESIAHVMGPQREIWVVNDGEGLPGARDLRLDVMPTNGIGPQQLSDIARKVDPDLFSGFMQTVDDHGRAGISILVKDGIAPWKTEPTSAIVKGYGEPFEVQINPSESTIRQMAKEYGEVRVIVDSSKNMYVWDANNAIHASIEHALDLDVKTLTVGDQSTIFGMGAERDIWSLKNGKLSGVFTTAEEIPPLLAELKSIPKGAAAVSAAADVGLLHLVEALDKAGVNAEILPTAVSINKRVANGEQGYGASLEQQAGMGALSALDAYRARIAEALKAGDAAPAFGKDLTKLALAHQKQQARLSKGAVRDWDESQVRFVGDVDYIQDPTTGQFQGSHPGGGHISSEALAKTTQKAKEGVAAGSKAALERGVKPLPGSVGHPNLIATRLITAAKRGPDAYAQPNVVAMKLNPANFASDMSLLKNSTFYPNFRPADVQGSPEQIARAAVDHMKANLRFLYEHSPNVEASKTWYDGARVIIDDRAKRYGMTDASVAGVYAGLSPQKDWDENVHLADVLLNIYATQQDHKWDEKMEATAAAIWQPRWHPIVDRVRGKTLGELKEPAEKAVWIRTFDQANSGRNYRTVLPTGQLDGLARNNPKKGETVGDLKVARWQTVPNIITAIKAIEANGDREKLSAAMPQAHKVRSFYNNMLDPHSPNGDVTSDTHQVGAALLRDLGGSSAAVLHNFGLAPDLAADLPGWQAASSSAVTGLTGLYPLYTDATRELAAELKIEPRQVQSVVWVTKRNLFESNTKQQTADIESAWQAYYAGTKTLQETQQDVVRIAGGFRS